MPDRKVILDAVTLACRAPSLHNSQPWRSIADGTLHLFADRQRLVPATDSSGREMILSCGAVLDHLRVAIAAAGWTPPSTGSPIRHSPTTSPQSNSVRCRSSATPNAQGPMQSTGAARTDYRSPPARLGHLGIDASWLSRQAKS